MKPTDIEKHAKDQLSRVSHLPGFPEAPLAVRDYIVVLCKMGTLEGITRLMDEIVAAEWEKCPTAHQLATIGHNLRESTKQKRAACRRCDGTGVLTIWKLVTYIGNTFSIKKAERLDTDYEGAMDLARRIAERPGTERQVVLSAAEACGCGRVA